MIVQPDRGWNRPETHDFVGRNHYVDFTLRPYYDNKTLEYQAAKSTFDLKYVSSTKYVEKDDTPTTGLNALSYRNGSVPIPIASDAYNHISLDAEGLVRNPDGSFWVSDEYGPYVYKYSPEGKLIDLIEPPPAFLPRLKGALFFDANNQNGTVPDQGRVPNQGYEGLTSNPDGTRLYILLQSSLTQDQGDDKGRYTRFLEYDTTTSPPSLVHAYIVELPVTNGKAKTLSQSEFHYISDDTFVVLSRDGKGGGDTDAVAKNKRFYLFSTSAATDIAKTTYTTDYVPVAPKNVLNKDVKAAKVTPWVDILDDAQLARFGIHNGDTDPTFDVSLLNSKWESIAFASVQDPAFPNDYFLFSFSDNDFVTQNGFQAGQAYSDPNSYTLDNQALVWRVTVPFPLQDA